jgi:hypothetical protein
MIGWYGLRSSILGWGSVESSWEQSSEPSGSIIFFTILVWLSDWQLLKKCSVPWSSLKCNWLSFISGVGLLVCGHYWPIVPAPDDRWWWLWRNWWNEDWQVKPKYSEKTCPSATLSTTNPTCLDPVMNPGRRGGKPATNRLSYGAASVSGY